MNSIDATRLIRLAMTMLASVTIIAVTPGGAAAKHRKHLVHHRCRCQVMQVAQLVAPPAPRLGPMRYYGGPKSPMWRGPAEP